MKKVLIAYYSRTGNTKQMAEYIEAPKLIFDTMEYVFKMDMTDLVLRFANTVTYFDKLDWKKCSLSTKS